MNQEKYEQNSVKTPQNNINACWYKKAWYLPVVWGGEESDGAEQPALQGGLDGVGPAVPLRHPPACAGGEGCSGGGGQAGLHQCRQ